MSEKFGIVTGSLSSMIGITGMTGHLSANQLLMSSKVRDTLALGHGPVGAGQISMSKVWLFP
jgi:hypothetical protein